MKNALLARFDDENVDADGKTKTFTYSKDETESGKTSLCHRYV